jgi:hypothetical protein
MPRWQQPPSAQAHEYQPRLPSDNALDYYLVAARSVVGDTPDSSQPPKPEEVRWVESNERAFRILQQGAGKPYRWILPTTPQTGMPTPIYGGFRRLARLVASQVRWAIATKDGMDAVRDWHVGVRFARDLQGDLAINYLVGVAVEGIVHAPIIGELDFFSSAECRAVADMLIWWERTPDRFLTVLEGEQTFALQSLDEMLPTGKPEALLEIIRGWNMDPETGKPLEPEEPDEGDEPHLPEERRRQERLRPQLLDIARSPLAYEQLRQQLRQAIVRHMQDAFRALRLPYGRQLQALRQPARDLNTPLGYLVDEMAPLTSHLLRVYLRQRARRRLLIAHLLLRVYYLREGSYPDSLHRLRLEELVIDPFSGKELVYRREGDKYRLYSVDENGKDDGGRRRQPGEHPVEGNAVPGDLFLTWDGWR